MLFTIEAVLPVEDCKFVTAESGSRPLYCLAKNVEVTFKRFGTESEVVQTEGVVVSLEEQVTHPVQGKRRSFPVGLEIYVKDENDKTQKGSKTLSFGSASGMGSLGTCQF